MISLDAPVYYIVGWFALLADDGNVWNAVADEPA